jgi:hypothetical protein
MSLNVFGGGPSSSVGIVTDYGLGDPGIESDCACREFSGLGSWI